MENSMDPPAIYWTRPVTCICLCSALDNSLGPLVTESPCSTETLYLPGYTITDAVLLTIIKERHCIKLTVYKCFFYSGMFEGSTYRNMPTYKSKNIILGLKLKTVDYNNPNYLGHPTNCLDSHTAAVQHIIQLAQTDCSLWCNQSTAYNSNYKKKQLINKEKFTYSKWAG